MLVVNPEITSGHLNFRDRDSHFIFGDASVALVVERSDRVKAKGAWEILSTRMMSKWSATAIRNNAGYLDICDPTTKDTDVDTLRSTSIASCFSVMGSSPSGLCSTQAMEKGWLSQGRAPQNRR